MEKSVLSGRLFAVTGTDRLPHLKKYHTPPAGATTARAA